MNDKMSNRPHIVVDYDSTLVNSQKAICDVYNKYYKKEDEAAAVWQNVIRWNMSCECPNVEVLDVFADPRFFDAAEYFEHAKEVMNSWHESGFDITICTAGTPENIALKVPVLHEAFPYANLVPISMMGSNGVGKGIVNMEGAIFIDDHMRNLEGSNAAYKILYHDESFNPDLEWAINSDKYKEVSNWKELDKLVRNIINKNSYMKAL